MADSDPIPGATLVAVLPERHGGDQTRRLLVGWIAAQPSPCTRIAYARDVAGPMLIAAGNGSRPRPPLVPPWLEYCAAAGADPITGVTRDHVNIYARMLDAAGLAPSTKARKLAAVSSWYSWMCEDGVIGLNPAANTKRPKVQRATSSRPGFDRLQGEAFLRAADEAKGPQRLRTSAMLAVLLLTGARISEITGADVEDLTTDRGNRALKVSRKGGPEQLLLLPPAAARRLDAYLATRQDLSHEVAPRGHASSGRPKRHPLFVTALGNRMNRRNVFTVIRRIGKAAGLPDDLIAKLGCHTLRRSFITLSLDAGVALPVVQDAAGHADPATTRIYDRSRLGLDEAPGHALAAYLAGAAG
jgi:integrase/recombinase XerD